VVWICFSFCSYSFGSGEWRSKSCQQCLGCLECVIRGFVGVYADRSECLNNKNFFSFFFEDVGNLCCGIILIRSKEKE
jgi:hypothetical protein